MPGLRRVGDITYLPTAEEWLYLAMVIDLCTRKVVGWSMADHMRTQLVADAIRMAHSGGHTAGNAIFHTDRGSQYMSRQFREILAELEIRQSAGRTGSCFDNAAAENFFAALKAEIGTTVWETRAAARQDVFRWIAEYYWSTTAIFLTKRHQKRRIVHCLKGLISCTPWRVNPRFANLLWGRLSSIGVPAT